MSGKPQARTMAGGDDRQYHIGLAPGELASHVLLCGDPARAERFAREHLDSVEIERRHREYVTFTGERAGTRLSVMATGMGPDNTEIALVEMSAILDEATIVRMGSCGALQPHIVPGELIVSTGAVRLENVSTAYVPEGFPAIADAEVVLALVHGCTRAGMSHHVGITATAPGFYGAQGRSVGPFRARDAGLLEELAACRVLNLEMESSTLFTLATLAGWRAGTICAAYASRAHDQALDEAERLAAEARCMAVAADAIGMLAVEEGDA